MIGYNQFVLFVYSVISVIYCSSGIIVLPPSSRRLPVFPLKNAVKIREIVKATFFSDLCDRIIGGTEQAL